MKSVTVRAVARPDAGPPYRLSTTTATREQAQYEKSKARHEHDGLDPPCGDEERIAARRGILPASVSPLIAAGQRHRTTAMLRLTTEDETHDPGGVPHPRRLWNVVCGRRTGCQPTLTTVAGCTLR